MPDKPTFEHECRQRNEFRGCPGPFFAEPDKMLQKLNRRHGENNYSCSLFVF